MLRLLLKSICLMILTTMLSGCLNSHTTRMPSLDLLHSQNPEIEKRSYELHDPYPDELSGPSTMSRPRAFNTQRTRDRRAFEQRALEGRGVPHGTAAPRLPSAQWKYPDAIRE